jgi:nucleotide-binding universal stress UspA family protein
MFTNVLIGVDGRQGGRDAIALAQELAVPDATLTLAHVYATFPGRGATEALQSERAASVQLLEWERELAALDAKLVVRGERPVGQGLHELAEEHRADLLVVGSTRHAPLGRVLMGDDCRAALDGTPCAIGIAPRDHARFEHRWEWLGVGYDESPESVAALAAARELAVLLGAKVKPLRVVSPEEVRREQPTPGPKAIDELLDRCLRRLAQLPDVYGAATYGSPREELARFATEVDLLVVGSRGYGPIGRLLHGSVSRYLLRHASCPLLVLPRAAVRDPEREDHDADAELDGGRKGPAQPDRARRATKTT